MSDAAPAEAKVLVVDDVAENVRLLGTALRAAGYQVIPTTSGEQALRAVANTPPDLILLDVMMPGMSGHEVLERLRADPRHARIPVIFVTAMTEEEDEERGLALGAVDYITKPISIPITLARVRTHLALSNARLLLESEVRERTRELHASRLEVARRLAMAAESRDPHTGAHINRMSRHCEAVAEAMGFPPEERDRLLNASILHDVGKIGIPDAILLKEGPLTEGERRTMESHVTIGAQMLSGSASPLMKWAETIARCHHEKWDGSGYIAGLQGEEIPLIARIASAADVFDALTSARPYKPAWTVEEALDEIEQKAGVDFDPAVVEALRGVAPRLRAIMEAHPG